MAMARWRRAPLLLLLSAAMAMCLGGCGCDPLPQPGADNKASRPHVYVRTNLQPTSPQPPRARPTAYHVHPSPSPSTYPRAPFTTGSRSPASSYPLRTPTSTSPQIGNKSPLSYYHQYSGLSQYQRKSSAGSSGYGSRSPSLSPQSFPPIARGGGNGMTHPKPAHAPAPAPGAASKATPCNCDCYKFPAKVLCAMDPGTRDKDTFRNECQVDCHNCTMKTRYKVLAHVPCDEYKGA